mgnify:CR=1 FL=1
MLETTTIIFMILILGFMWGGFLYFLNRAYKKESR